MGSPPPDWQQRLAVALGPGGSADARADAASWIAALAESHERLRERLDLLQSASFEGIFAHVDGSIIDANDRLCELLGYSRDEILGPQTMGRCVAPEDLPRARQHMATHYEGAYVIGAIRKDGSRFRAELQSKQGRVGDRPVRVIAVRDVTERERTNLLLHESERRFRALVTAAFDVIVFTREGVIVDVAGDLPAIFGRAAAELTGRRVLDFTAASAIPDVTRAMGENLEGSYEAAAMHASGEIVPISVVAASTTLDGAPVRVVGLRDLRPRRRLEAERRGLEQQVERAQRLESLGVLAGGIAHDFNNLLSGVLGNADVLLARLTDPGDRQAAEEIVAAAQRAATLTRQMLAYAGQRDLGRREPLEVGPLILELRTLLGATLSKKATLRLELEPGAVVRGDHATLSQVMMNLLTNASDALGDRPGHITVTARRVHDLDARWDDAQGATVGPGAWVLLEVRDTGVGIDPAIRGRIFEPFFSTKERGHGLGLAACLGIVSAHGGAILVESEVGRGSCFSVVLPAGTLVEPPAAARTGARRTQPCHVLVVDDEPLVRAQLRRALELRGYTVEEAANGEAALAALARERTAVPDVVVLDMTMPDLDGAEVVRRVRAAGSRVPIVVSSGYLDGSIERRLPRGAFQGFLAKPYGASDLVSAIERALASA